MSVEPGFGGQAFIEGSLAKIEYLREARERRNLSYLIEVDGGIDTDTAPRAVRAGADVLVAGTSLMRRDDMASAMAELRRAVEIFPKIGKNSK
jgi:ribulose-phosphate 3-epimerase